MKPRPDDFGPARGHPMDPRTPELPDELSEEEAARWLEEGKDDWEARRERND